MSVLDVLKDVLTNAGPVPMQCLVEDCTANYVAGSTSGTVGLVGYSSPPGHNHDDNCRKFAYACSEGHVVSLTPRRRCPNRSCDWVGKDSCFCTNIVEKLPAVDQDTDQVMRKRKREGLPMYWVKSSGKGKAKILRAVLRDPKD